MGWCSATEIMDAAVAAADAAVVTLIQGMLDAMSSAGRLALWESLGVEGATEATRAADVFEMGAEVVAAMRPFVATIAEKLRDGDWDCIEESAYFNLFPQEMLGHDDREYQAYLHEQLKYADPGDGNYNDLVRRLADINAKLEEAD